MKAHTVRTKQGRYQGLRLHVSEYQFDTETRYGARIFPHNSTYKEYLPVSVGTPATLDEAWDNAVKFLDSVKR